MLGDRYWLGTEIFTTPRRRLALVELKKRFQSYGEYTAAIIYSRRNNIPLYFVDKYDIPPERVANLNVTEIGNPISACTPRGQVKAELIRDSDDMTARNIFMAAAIDIIAQKYPGKTGLHIGGAGHITHDYTEGKQAPLIQEFLETPVAGVTILPFPEKRSAFVRRIIELKKAWGYR